MKSYPKFIELTAREKKIVLIMIAKVAITLPAAIVIFSWVGEVLTGMLVVALISATEYHWRNVGKYQVPSEEHYRAITAFSRNLATYQMLSLTGYLLLSWDLTKFAYFSKIWWVLFAISFYYFLFATKRKIDKYNNDFKNNGLGV